MTPRRRSGVAVLIAVGILWGALGCSNDDGAVGAPASDGPVCDAMVTIADVWRTRAPERVLGNPPVLSDFAAGLEGALSDAVDVMATEAPPAVVTALEEVEAAVAEIYADALAYAGGDMERFPTQDAAQRNALATVETWARSQCPDTEW